MTEYVILETVTTNTGRTFNVNGKVEAPSGEAAVRKHVASTGEGGTFVAVPARSFQTIRVEIEKVSKFKVVSGSHAAEPAPTEDAA